MRETMSGGMKTSRTHVWLEGMGEWSWPGRTAAAELQPPSWVPAFPRRLEPAGAVAGMPGTWTPQRGLARRFGPATLLAGLAAICVALALTTPLSLEHLVGVHASAQPAPEAAAATARSIDASPPPLPAPKAVSHDAAGSSIDTASYTSHALHGPGSFLVYLPPGYASTTRHYPVLYLLHGDDQSATAFLEIGLQGELDRLIAQHVIPPLIAVMIEGGHGSDNWRNIDGLNYESYVTETQELVDRMLPTFANRGARAIAGDSMGGYGAMNVALHNPDRFAVVESWLGFFNGLEGLLHSDEPIISHMGLHAFVYGGESDDIADPAEDAPFAAALRAAGATAYGAVFPGGHSLETVQAHLGSMLAFAGRGLSRTQSGHTEIGRPAGARVSRR